MGRYHVATAVAAIALIAGQAGAQVCVGNCGELGANGVVTSSPAGDPYQWVSTAGGITGNTLAGVGGTNGSTYTTTLFSAGSGDDLVFNFNYVTSDGAGYADYAWAELLNTDLSQAALLFTARTTPGGNSVPGFGMPANDATLEPPTVTITYGSSWLPLAGSSGACYSTGCGHTGWVESTYEIIAAGNYFLRFGVANWGDFAFDSGLAFDGATIGGVPIDTTIPEPGTLVLLASGLAALIPRIRRKLKKH